MKQATAFGIFALALALLPVSPSLALNEDKILQERYRIEETPHSRPGTVNDILFRLP